MEKIKGETATVKYQRVSPIKARRILPLIKNKSYDEAVYILNSLPHKAARLILNVLNNVASNYTNLNPQVDKENLYIKEIYVNQGPVMKRMKPRAHGRADVIRKPTAHITITLEKTEEAK